MIGACSAVLMHKVNEKYNETKIKIKNDNKNRLLAMNAHVAS